MRAAPAAPAVAEAGGAPAVEEGEEDIRVAEAASREEEVVDTRAEVVADIRVEGGMDIRAAEGVVAIPTEGVGVGEEAGGDLRGDITAMMGVAVGTSMVCLDSSRWSCH